MFYFIILLNYQLREDKNIMKKYQVVWDERHSVEVVAGSEKEACEIVLNCEHDEIAVSAELNGPPEAYEVK